MRRMISVVTWMITMATVAAMVAGCGATRPTDVRDALDAVQAASEAARTELGDAPVASGVVQLLSLAVDGYRDIAYTESQPGERWQYYVRWIGIAARLVSSVVTILDAAGVDVPDAIRDAQAVLMRWVR